MKGVIRMKANDDFYNKMVDEICEKLNVLRDYVATVEDDLFMPEGLIDSLTDIRYRLERTKARKEDDNDKSDEADH